MPNPGICWQRWRCNEGGEDMKQYPCIPAIHLNGTSANALCEEILTAHGALMQARHALADMTVHGRDHYVKADKESFSKAQAEHVARLAAIDKIVAELGEIYQGIRDQT
jgi:hypothetical protein